MKDNDFSFKLNYLRFYQFKADTVESRIEHYNALSDDLLFFKQGIAEIREDAGPDGVSGLSHTERVVLHQYEASLGDTLQQLDEFGDAIKLTGRLHHLEQKIEHHADIWGIDSW